MRTGAVAACLLALVCAGNLDLRAEDRVVSGTLLQELDTWATLAIDDVVKSGKPLPEGVTKQDMKDQTIRSFQPFLMVTKEDEEKFARGEFDDGKNQRLMEAQIEAFKKAETKLPLFSAQSIAAYKKGELKGGKLELAVRMNMLPYVKVRDALQPDKPVQAESKESKEK